MGLLYFMSKAAVLHGTRLQVGRPVSAVLKAVRLTPDISLTGGMTLSLTKATLS